MCLYYKHKWPSIFLSRIMMQSCQAVIRNESEILNVGMSKPPKVASRPAGGLRGAVSAPEGYGAANATRSKKYVSKMKKKYYL